MNIGPRESALIKKQDSASGHALQEIKNSIYPSLILASDFQKLMNRFLKKISKRNHI
jgi:hypothetical protein